MKSKEKAEEIIKLPESERVKALLAIEDDRDYFSTLRHCLSMDMHGKFRGDRTIIDRAIKIREEMTAEETE